MTFEIVQLIRGLVTIRLDGKSSESRAGEIRTVLFEEIQRHAKISVLVLLEDFAAANRRVFLEAVNSLREHSQKVEKVAIVSESLRPEDMDFPNDAVGRTAIGHFSFSERNQAVLWLLKGH
jgi:hypothetical protein